MTYPKTVEEILKITNQPIVSANQRGEIDFINKAFAKAYGWELEDVAQKSITTIMPEYMRDTHNMGFSRFLATETPRVAGKPLSLPMKKKDGAIIDVEHFILAERQGDEWRFAAVIYPHRHHEKT